MVVRFVEIIAELFVLIQLWLTSRIPLRKFSLESKVQKPKMNR